MKNLETIFGAGLCYGKLEAGALVFVIPTLLLGRLVTAVLNSILSGSQGLSLCTFDLSTSALVQVKLGYLKMEEVAS
jgi:hypothetical protein